MSVISEALGDHLLTNAADLRAGEQAEHERRIDGYLQNRRAIHATDRDALGDYLRVLDFDPAEDIEIGLDDEGNALVETVSDRLWNYAEREGLLWTGDDDEGVVLFVKRDLATEDLFRTAHRSQYPEITIFPACAGLELLDLAACFHRAGFDLDGFRPVSAPLWTTEELTEDMIDAATPNEPFELEDATTADDLDWTAPNTPLDLRRERTIERPPTAYYEPGLIPVGRYLGLSGEAGAGKSLVVRDFCLRWSQGRSALDPGHRFGPAQVVILDAENGPAWWAEGLDRMDAPLDLPNLRVICYPEFDGGLDTERGARSFLRLVESLGEIDVLVIDTVSRFVGGSENDADTWHGFYRNAILPLRRAGIGVIRLDHLGKNAELGARGSSAKMSDLDAHYILTAKSKGSNDLTLKLDKRRQADYDETIRILRSDGPLRHTRVPDGKLTFAKIDGAEVPEDAKVAALVKELDRLRISHTLARRDQRNYYGEKSGTVKAGTEIWNSAMKFRRERAERSIEG